MPDQEIGDNVMSVGNLVGDMQVAGNGDLLIPTVFISSSP